MTLTRGLNHVAVLTDDLDRFVAFYTEVFGMEVVAREPRANAAFLRLARSGNHHDLGLFGVGTAAGPKRRGAIGLYHLAWQVDTIDELVAARESLLGAGAYTGSGSVITRDVAADALALGRGVQAEKAGWAVRFRETMTAKKKAAKT